MTVTPQKSRSRKRGPIESLLRSYLLELRYRAPRDILGTLYFF